MPMTDAPQNDANTEAQELARKAARLARSEGYADWKSLPKETRLEYRRRVQEQQDLSNNG